MKKPAKKGDKLNRLARERGAGEGPPPVEEPSLEAAPDKAPWIELPRDGRLVGAFASELGAVCASNGIYRRDKTPVTINKETGLLEPMQADEFVGYIEGVCVPCVRKQSSKVDDESGEVVKESKKLPKSINLNLARVTLRHPSFVFRQRALTRVNPVPMPIMRGDGRIEMLREGYDKESGVLTLKSDVRIRDNVGLEEARFGLFDLFSEFNFADWDKNRSPEKTGQSCSLSVQIAAMLGFYGALLLPLNAARPGTLCNANSHRAGKTLQVMMIITPVMGKCILRAMPKNEDEFRKLLETCVLGAAPYLALDNLSGNLRSDDLDAFITSADWGGRRMHTQTEFAGARQTIVFITGHNLTLSPDLAGRLLESRLYIEEADVQTRKIKRPINDAWLKQPNVRSDILSFLWALIREWDKGGRPKGDRGLAGFQEWCNIFNGITKFAGFGDPCDRPVNDESADTELEDMTSLVVKLAESLSESGERLATFAFSEVLELCVENNCFTWMIEGKWKTSEGQKYFDATTKTEAALGKMLSMRYGGRIFKLKDGRRVQFGKRGKNRHRRYEVALLKAD